VIKFGWSVESIKARDFFTARNVAFSLVSGGFGASLVRNGFDWWWDLPLLAIVHLSVFGSAGIAAHAAGAPARGMRCNQCATLTR
jgi:hypothetical protein